MSLDMPMTENSYERFKPWLNSDEWILVNSLDDKFKHSFDLQNKLLEDQRLQNYMANQPDQYQLNNPEDGADMQAVPGLEAMQGHGMQGGFAFAPLLPILGSIAGPLIGMAVDGIKALINRKKGQGALYPPNYGRGISAPNGGGFDPFLDTFKSRPLPYGFPSMHEGLTHGSGAIVEDWLSRNRGQLQSMENHLGNLRGKEFWHELVGLVKKSVRDIIPQVAEVSPQIASHVTDLVVNKVIPASFQKIRAKQGKGVMRRNKGGFSVMSAVKPIVKWALGKLIKKSDTVNKIYRKIKDTGSFMDASAEKEGVKYGSGSFFGKVKDIAKKILVKTLPTVSSISERVVGPAVDNVLGRFGAPPIVSDLVGNVSKNLIHGVSDAAHDMLTERPSDYAGIPATNPANYTYQQGYMNPQRIAELQQEAAQMERLKMGQPKTTGVYTGYEMMNPSRIEELRREANVPTPPVATSASTVYRGRGPAKKKLPKKLDSGKLKFNIKML